MVGTDVCYRLWMRGLRALGSMLLHGGYRLEIEGAEHVPAAGGVLCVSNHVSFHDWLFVGVALRRPPRFVMHRHHFRYPALRAFFRASRVIPIAPRKEDPAALERALQAIDDALGRGELVVLFPEGTMSPDGALSPFRPGLERIVLRRPVPVVPIGICGLFGSFFSRAHGAPMSGWPARLRAPVTVRIGRPIAPARADVATVRAQIERLLRDEPGRCSEVGKLPAAPRTGTVSRSTSGSDQALFLSSQSFGSQSSSLLPSGSITQANLPFSCFSIGLRSGIPAAARSLASVSRSSTR